jgi:hypothetical protein
MVLLRPPEDAFVQVSGVAPIRPVPSEVAP